MELLSAGDSRVTLKLYNNINHFGIDINAKEHNRRALIMSRSYNIG